MSDRGCTESEDRLLAQYELLRDIKEGRRKPIGPVRIQQQPQRAAEPVSTEAATVRQKQPSRLRFKAVTKSATSAEQPSSPPAPSSPPGQAPTPAVGVAGFAAAAAAPTTAAAAPSTTEQPVRSTISREQLAALLRKKQEQKQVPAEGAAQAPLQADATVEALTVVAQTPAAAAQKPQQQPRSQPKLLKLPSAAPAPVMAQQTLNAVSRRAAAADEIDYDAVSSPEYEVDYDAVSSPEYEVSDQQTVAAAVPSSNSKQDAHIRTCTPERVDSRKSPAAGWSNADHTINARSGSAAARRRSCSRSSRSCSPTQRLHSRSPTQRLRSESHCQRLRRHSRTLRSRSPLRRSRSRSVTPLVRWHSRSRSPAWRARSRSPSPLRQPHNRSSRPLQHTRSRDSSRDWNTRGRSWRRGISRSRSPRPQRPWRRGSPDYGVGAGPGAGSGQLHRDRSRSNSRSPSPRAGSAGKGRLQLGSNQGNPTLFVGDLPPVGFASDDLRALFSAFGWNIVSARVQGSQCYGFVEFDNRTDAEEALHLIEVRHEGFCVNDTFVRASWAKGSMPDWKRGKAVLSRRDQAQGLEGLEAYEHPTARLLRLQAAVVARAAVANGVAVQCGGMDAASTAVPMHTRVVVPGLGPRQLIDYGDL